MRPGTILLEPLTESDRERVAAGLTPLPLTDLERVALRVIERDIFVVEKNSSDHFYGAWRTAKGAGGGRPAGVKGIPHTDGVDNHPDDLPKTPTQGALNSFRDADPGDRIEALVASGKKRGQSVRGTIVRRSADSITVNAGGTRVTIARDAIRHFGVTRHGLNSDMAKAFWGPRVAREAAFDAFLTDLTEKAGDDHFYGAWRGGKASAGGGPVGEDTMAQHRGADGKWDAERVASVHQPYVDSTMKGIPASKVQPPTVYMTGGGPATGKTKGLLENPKTGIPGKTKAAHIDPDSAKQAIPEYRAGVKAGDRTIASHVHEESSHMSKLAVAANLAAGHDVVYDSVGDSGIAKLAAKVQQMRDAGAARVHAAYATTTVETAFARADARALKTGRYVPHAFIAQAHQDVTRTTLAAINKGIFDKLDVWDTEGTPRLIARYTKTGGLVVKNKSLWARFLAKAEAN